MAERRMFAKSITNSDAFMEMPMSAQCLYFHLSMNADDDGFVNKPKSLMRMIGAKDDDLKILIAKAFILIFEDGVVVIKHWRINNYIQKDRYRGTEYTEHKNSLEVKENGAYTWHNLEQCIQNGYKMDTSCIQDGYKMDTQDSIGKVSIGKNRLDESSIGQDNARDSADDIDDLSIVEYLKRRKDNRNGN